MILVSIVKLTILVFSTCVGSYTVADDVKRKGMFDLCQFCTSTQVILHGRYQIVKQVGEGNFSVVYLAQDLLAPTSAAVALKIFHQQYEEIGLEVRNSAYNKI